MKAKAALYGFLLVVACLLTAWFVWPRPEEVRPLPADAGAAPSVVVSSDAAQPQAAVDAGEQTLDVPAPAPQQP